MLFGIKPLQQGFCQARNFEDAPIDETQKVFRRAEAQSMRARIFGCIESMHYRLVFKSCHMQNLSHLYIY